MDLHFRLAARGRHMNSLQRKPHCGFSVTQNAWPRAGTPFDCGRALNELDIGSLVVFQA